MKVKDEHIKTAIDCLQDKGIVNKEGKYDPLYKGYISSFGASLIQMGLLPSVILYESSSSSTGGAAETPNKGKVIAVIIEFLATHFNRRIQGKLSAYILSLNNPREKVKLLKEVGFATAVIKLSLRMFKEKEG